MFFLNKGSIHLYFSTRDHFLLKFKLTQCSINFIDMATKKQDGRRGFNTYFQQGYQKNYYIVSFETNFTFKSDVIPAQPTKII